jgi:hypothetical protein
MLKKGYTKDIVSMSYRQHMMSFQVLFVVGAGLFTGLSTMKEIRTGRIFLRRLRRKK